MRCVDRGSEVDNELLGGGGDSIGTLLNIPATALVHTPNPPRLTPSNPLSRPASEEGGHFITKFESLVLCKLTQTPVAYIHGCKGRRQKVTRSVE